MKNFEKKALNKVVRGPQRALYNKEEIYKIVDSHMMCHVSYTYNDIAMSIPTGHGRDGDTLYIHGSLKNRMMLSLLNSHTVSATITHLDGLVLARSTFHHSVNYRSATIFGTPRLVEDPTEKMKALELITENFLPGRWDEARHPNEKEFKSTLVIAIDITDASAKKRAEGVSDEPEDLALDIWAGVLPLEVIAKAPIPEPDLKPHLTTPPSVQKAIDQQKIME